MSSPYKKFKSTNQEWIGYINISKLQPMKAYKMLSLLPTNHVQYGPGYQATIQASNGKKFKTQLPGKYLSRLTKEEIATIVADAASKKSPFLVFREIMVDNSYRIEIIEKSDEMVVKFESNEDIAELEESVTEDSPDAGGEGDGAIVN